MSKRARVVSSFKAGKRVGKRARHSQGPSGMPKPIPRSAPPPVNARTGGLLGVELKFYDLSYTADIAAPDDSTGAEADPATVLCLSAPGQGDGASERIGRSIQAHSIAVEGIVRQTNIATGSTSIKPRVVFVALVLDTQTNGAQLNSEDVYTNPLGNAITSVCCMRNISERGRFRVLAVKRLSLTPVGTWNGTNVTAYYPERYFRFYRKLNGMEINFKSGGNAGVANVTDRSLHVLCFSTDASADAPSLYYNSRFRYTG